MITALIGHRGVGKTTLARQVGTWAPTTRIYDLDTFIEDTYAVKIAELFLNQNESLFRELEERALFEICQKHKGDAHNVVIAIGAGYKKSYPDGLRKVFVQRTTDANGRVFLASERPRLNAQLSQWDESRSLYIDREKNYLSNCDQILFLPEKMSPASFSQTEIDYIMSVLFLTPIKASLCFDHCLLPGQVTQNFLTHLLQTGVRKIEVRDDLLSAEEFDFILKNVPPRQLLISLRTDKNLSWGYRWLCGEQSVNFEGNLDWPLEWGVPLVEELKSAKNIVLSFHGDNVESLHEPLEAFIQSMTSTGERTVHVKWAPKCNGFDDLIKGHAWWQADVKSRSFLPMSDNGQWKWYRCRYGSQMQIHFVRAGRSPNTVDDQPTWLEQWAGQTRSHQFAAVIGDPVNHSLTPALHEQWLTPFSISVYAIRIADCDSEFRLALNWLADQGLFFCAITSPHKLRAFTFTPECSNREEKNAEVKKWKEVIDSNSAELESVNTLVFDQRQHQLIKANTDYAGLLAAAKTYNLEKLSPVVLWGGGGTLAVVAKVFPHAICYSARTGMPKKHENSLSCFSENTPGPQLLIWAVGRKHQQSSQWPPSHWQPNIVLDLNYSEDSPGKEYASRAGIEYISGIEMFKKQGLSQFHQYEGFIGS